MPYVTLLVGLLLSAALLWVGWDLRRGLNSLFYALKQESAKELADRLDRVEWLVDELPQKWEEMVKQAKRSEDRSRAVVRRAMEELEEAGYEHAGVEAEASELRLQHGNGSQSPRVQPVPTEVGGGGEVPGPPVEDWERVTAQRKFGGG